MICIITEFYARGVQLVTHGSVCRCYLVWHLFCHSFPPPQRNSS